jgi:hypothetical protein
MVNLKNLFNEGRVKAIAIIFISVYCVVMSFFTVCSLINILNADEKATTTVIKICFFDLTVSKEIRLVLLAAVMGILGSLIYSMTSFISFVGNNKFTSPWTLWYIFRPFIGIPLAIMVYLALRGGVLNWDAGNIDNINENGIAAICGLVGMFSKEAIAKLREVFVTLFTVQKDDLGGKLKDEDDKENKKKK